MRLSSLGEAERAARRAGIEASGSYERAIVARPRTQGLEVGVFQPKQARAYAMFRLQRAKPFGGLRRKHGRRAYCGLHRRG
ncbi:MAG: hypothetical protein WBF43_05560 [Methylocella sp.]